nr:DoxX family protein [Pedobacter sp. ASV19]
MRRIFNTNYNHQSLDFALLLLRIGIAAFMLTHGLSKINPVLSGAPIQFGDPLGLGEKLSFFLTVFAEVGCSVLLLFGLATRLAVIPLIVTMVVAIFIIHAPDAFAKKELAWHYLIVYVFLLFSGAGRYSVDALIGKKPGRRR